jgi:hypothetical protein
VLLGLQPLTTTAYLLRVLPANIKTIAGMARSYNEVRLYPKHTQDSLLRLLKKTRYCSGIKGPGELGIVVNALQYRNPQAVFLEQILIFSDVDFYRGDSCTMENCLCLCAEVAEWIAVEFGNYMSRNQYDISNSNFSG